ncbi:MAG: hypothetical protein IJ210_15270 [Clostridia bacterium]|nr:hypothetical protein [Clostridia bacterium]
MSFFDFLFGGAKNNKEEEERKKKEQEQAGKRINDAIGKWISDNSSKWTPAGTATQQPQTPTFSAPKPTTTTSDDVYNNTVNNIFGFGTPNLSAGATKKITGNSPLLTINEDAVTGNRNGWGYGSGDAPSKEASKEWDDLLDPTSSLSKSMDQQQRVRRINSEIPAWYVNAHKQGTKASATQNVGSKYLQPEDGILGVRDNMVKNVSALYDQRETGRFDYQKDPWGNLADPSLYSDDYLQQQVDYFTDQTAAKKSRAESAIHGIEDINEAMAWSYMGRDFEHDTNPVSDFELEGFAKYVEGTGFDPNMTDGERQAMANRYLEWGKNDGVTKLQEQLNSNRTGQSSTYVENAGVSDAYEDWLGKLNREQTFRFDYGHMRDEAQRDPNFTVNATYDGPLHGNDFASRLYNALNDETERFKFDLPYENGGAANPITAEGYDLMTPDELNLFNWYAKQGRGQEYLDMMKNTLQHRNAEAQSIVTQYYATKDAGSAAVSWLGARFANLGTAMLYPIQAANALLGGETDAASSLYAPNRFVNDVSEAQTQAIANSNFLQIPGFAPGTNLGTWLYSAATSAADSLLGVTVGTTLGGGANTGLGKTLANLVMSSTAASHALEENLLRGMDPTQAFLTSVADGAAEAITETWSIESLLSDPTHFLSYLAKNVFSEASEEGASSILQAIGDRLINGDNSQMASDVKTLVLLGVPQEDAEKRVMGDWLKETLQGMAIGGLSGGMSAGGWQIGNAIGEAGAGRQINRSIFQNAQRSFLNNQAQSQTETATAQQTEEAERRAPETPDKAPMGRTQDEAQPKTAPAEDQRRAPETPDKAPVQREQDVVLASTAPAEDQRRAPETPTKAPVQRENAQNDGKNAQNDGKNAEADNVNAETDNVNENVDNRRAPEQPIQQSARSREAEQVQAAENQPAQDQQSTRPAEPAKRRAPEKPTKEARNAANRAVLETQQKVADIGATLAEGSEARKVAEAALKKLQKGQRLGGRRTYQLYSKVYDQLGEDVGSAVKTAARQDIDLRLQEAGMESEEARRASGALADILTGNTDNVGDEDLKNLLTTRQTRELLQAFTGIDSKELNRKLLETAGEMPQVAYQLRESAYYNPDNRKTMDSWSMMRRILSGQYTFDGSTSTAGSQESGEAAQADQERRNGSKEEITYADADGNDVTGTIVKITTRAAGQKAVNELRTKAATQPVSQDTKTTSQQTQSNEAAMEGLSEEAKEEWRKIQQDRENGPRQVKVEAKAGPTMEEFHKTLRGQMSARMGEDLIDSVNDIVLTVRDGNGNTSEISIDDVTGTANDGVQAMLEYAMATPEILGDGKLNLMYQWYQGEQPENYLTAFNNVYNAGFSDYIMDPVAISTLGDTRAQAIFDAGQQAAQAAENVRKANIRNVGKGKGTLSIQGIDNSSTEAVNAYLDTLDENQRASYEALRPLAKATGINIVLFRSQADENGRITSENGHYDPYTNSLYLDVNAGMNMSAEEYAAQGRSVPHYAILRTAGHELTHFIENSSADGYARLRAYVETELLRNGSDTFEELIERKMDLYARAGNPLTREGAISEVIADSMEMILQDSKAIQRMANQDASVFQRIRNWLHTFADNIRKAFTGVEADSLEARAIQRMGHYADQLVKLWDDALMEASANNAQADQQAAAEITEAAATESVNMAAATDAPVQPANGNVLQSAVANATQAKGTDGGDLFSLRSMTEDKETLLDMVRKTGVMSVNEINQLSRTIDAIMDRVEQNPDILDFGQNIGRNNRSFVPVKPNSDPLYKVSLDLSTLCRKRILQQAIQERLENQYNTVLTPQQRVAVRDALFQLAKQGKKIEVACALCYVESARLKSPAQIDRWLKNKDEFMRVYFSKANKAYAQQIQDRVDAMARELGYEEGTSLKQMSGKDNKAIHKMKAEMYRQYQPTAEEQKIIETAKALPETMYKTAQGLWELKQQHPEIFESFTTHVRNATKSKGIEGDTPFYAGDTDSVSDALIKAMNAENGMRMQSWSDYQVYHTLDYISAMIELGSRGAKVQTYTKVPAFLKLMGHTGAMINMSMIPADYNGQTLEYDNVEGMDYDTMMELRDAYHATAGNIVIGISDAHIRALLAANDVDYVIPYHKSSLNAKMREAIGLKAWTDFEKYQNETNHDYDNTIKNDKYRKHVNFSEWFNLAEARRYAQEYTRLPQAQRTQGNDVAAAGRYAMQKMADRYIELCHERGLQEKFAQFANEDGYWKLLIDRKMVDNVTGEIIEQQPVKPIFSKDDILDVLNDEVKRFQAANNDQQEATEAIVKMWEEGKIQEAAKSTKIMNYFQNYYAHVAAAISQGPAEVANPTVRTAAVQHSLRDSMDASRELMQAIERGDTERAQEIETSDATLQYSIREEDPPKKTVIAYKAFYARDGKLYPPMISNQSEKEQKVSKATTGTMKGLPTPVGVWLNADVGGIAVDPETGEPFRASTTGRLRAWNAKSGGGPGKTPSASNTLAFRPGWHLGEWPDAKQFNKNDPVTGKQKSVMPDDLVFAKCEIAADVDYQLESIAYGVGSNGKFNRSQAGLPRIPTDGFYKYRTNPDPDTAPWYITGAMRVIEILDDDDCAEICAQYGVKPDERYSHKKINLADYGLKRGPVEPTTDVDAYRKNAANYANEEILERALNDTNFSNAYVEREINFDDPIVANEFAINKQDVEEYRRKYTEQREQKAIQKSLRLEPMTTTREYIMGLTDEDLQTEAERAVLAKYRQKVTEYGTAAAAREKYENDLLNYNGQDQNELTRLNNRAQLAREKLNRVQAELEQIEKSNAFVRIAADARQAMSVIQSVAGSGNVDQYLETMRTRLANAQSRMDDILKDLEGWPKPTEGTTARMVFGKTQLSQKVSDLMRSNPSTLSKDEVTDSLAHIALLYQIGDTQAIEDANREVEELARKLQLQKNESIESYELTQLADAIGAFSLNDNQKKEVKRVYGSINNFKKALAGYGRYDPKATNLDANWAEMVELTGNQLDPNIGDAEEPIALVEFISRTVQSAQEAAALSPEDAQNELIEIQTEILTAATDLHAAIPMSRETLTAIQDLIKTFGSRADKLGDQLVQLLHDSEHARANADLAQATYTANGGRIIKGVDAIRSYYSQVADQYTKEILLQKERELRDRYANQMRILRTNAAQRLQEQANNYRQQIKDVRELRDISQKIRTARNVVRRQVMRVNKLLLQETNTKNVPEGLKGLAEALVTAFARADQNGRGIILSEGEANNLILEYSYLMRRDGELDSYAYDPDILEQLKTIKDQLDEYRMASIGHSYYDLDNQRKRLAICQNIAATVNDLTSLIVNANYAFIDGKKVDVGAAADRIAVPMLSMKDYGRPTGGIGRMASNVDEFARWGNMTPYYFKRQIDNAGFTPLMDDLERSEHRWGLQMQSAHDRINEMRENYHAADWTDDTLRISDNRGGTIEITRGQAMSILAIWQREHHDKFFQSHHLEVGGFVLADDGGKLGKGLLGLDRNAVGRTRGSRITQAEINAIEAWLTDEQKAYMREMISYLSNDMSDIGNETSMKLYGIKKYKEKVYFPIQSYRGALTMKSDAGAASTTNDSRIEHVGFSNARLRDANNTILIDDFSKVAAGHVQQMLMYANFAPTIEALNKVLNAQFEFEDGEKMRIRQMFENKYGKNAKDYLQDYIKALNGGVNPDTQDSLAGKMISLFKKTAVVGSVSVAAKQPMSIIRAATMINPRYLAAAAAKNLGTLHGSKSFEEARKYAGTAVIKDIGKFDTGVGMSNVDWLLERDSQEYDLWTKAKEALNPRDWEAWKNRWNEILGFLPEKGDTVTWGAMWEAVKMEQHALHPSMNQYSQEFLQMCGERFNTVMRATQVYDSTIARSPNLRSRSQFMKMLTAFMNEPVLTANMLYDSIKNIKKPGMKDRINPAAAGATFLLSAAAQAFITSLFSALRSDDKEKTIAEKMAASFGQNLRGEVNPFNLIPGVADIVEILEGGEVERADLSVLTDAVNKMTKLASGKYAITDAASGWKAVEDVGGSIAKLFGVPVKNVMRELRTVYNVFTQPARATDPTVFRLSLAEGLHVLPDKFLGFTLIDNSTQAYVERMYKALRSGDTNAAADYKEYLIDGKGVKEGSIKSKIKSLLYADYASEQIGIDEAIQFGMDQELWKKEKDAYSALIQAADKADHSDEAEYKTSAYVKIYDALLAGDKAAYNAAAKDMASHGYTDKAIQSEAKSQIGKWYKDGELSQAQATSMLAMLGVTAKNDVYWTLDAWDYQAENGDSTGYNKYDDFFEAVESGKGLQAAIQAQVQHSDKTEKEVRSTLASQITSRYKEQYVQLVRAGRTGEAANLQARLLTAYEALGYNRAKKLKDIQKWLK